MFLPVKAINELRRSALEKLRAGRIADCRRQSRTDAETEKDAPSGLAAVSSARPEPAPSLTQPELSEKRPAPCSLSASVTTLPQFLACLNAGVSRIYVSYAAMNGEMEDGLKAAKAEGISSEIFLSLPVILRAETRKQMKRVKALLDTGLFEGRRPLPFRPYVAEGKRLEGERLPLTTESISGTGRPGNTGAQTWIPTVRLWN